MDRWKRLFLVFMIFTTFDDFSTFLFASSINDEAWFSITHYFMLLTNSVFYGLIIHWLCLAVVWATSLLKMVPYLVRKVETEDQNYLEILVVCLLGLCPSSLFVGATTWYFKYYKIQDLYIRIYIGYAMYMLSLFWVKPCGLNLGKDSQDKKS